MDLEYKGPKEIPYYEECAPVVGDAGFVLLELQVVPQHGKVHVVVVIASGDPAKDIGVADCATVHRALAPRIIALTGKSEDDVYMEVSSPGLERTIRNAFEFSLLKGRGVRVWNRSVGDWVSGTIDGSDGDALTLGKQDGTVVSVPYADIAKAKLLNI